MIEINIFFVLKINTFKLPIKLQLLSKITVETVQTQISNNHLVKND